MPQEQSERRYAIRHDPSGIGLMCADCRELLAEDRPELYRETEKGWAYVCRMCGWDHAPWLVSLLNLGDHADWSAWGGEPPTPERLRDLKLTTRDLLGTQEDEYAPVSQGRGLASPSVNKRATSRVPLRLAASLATGLLTRGYGWTRDLGPDGIFVETELPLVEGAHVRLDLELPRSYPLRLRSVVVRSEAAGAALLLDRVDTHRLFELALQQRAEETAG